MRIAVIGTGISGLTTAWLLSARHDVTVFEKSARIGGHSNTATIDYDGVRIDVDTGFIVYNEPNYPNLVRLFDHLNVTTEASNMSFSASIDGGRIEYAGSALSSLFAQKRNLFRPSFLHMIKDFGRFCRLGKAALQRNDSQGETLLQFLDTHGFTKSFRHYYLLPMAASIWSAPCAQILDYPSASFLRFFANHGLLDIGRHPQWRTVTGGSINYVRKLAAPLLGRIELEHRPRAVRRKDDGIELVDRNGETRRFDQIVLACHADQCLDLLADANEAEKQALAAIRFQPNHAILHRDAKLMPTRRAVWASWNYAAANAASIDHKDTRVSATYWMNLLQNIDLNCPLFVTLNPLEEPDPSKVFARFDYDHPVLDSEAHAGQTALKKLQGQDRVWFAGAWLGYGFHEDGLVSALDAARALGARVPWEDLSPKRSSGAMAFPDQAAALPS